jgi:hypothetical protein
MQNKSKIEVKMKFSFVKRIIILILAVALLVGSIFIVRLFSAPPKYEEIEERFHELLENAYEANLIMYGEGLPVYEHVSDPKSSTEVIHTGEFTTNADGDEKERLIYYYYTLETEHKVIAYRDSYLKDYAYALLSNAPLDIEELKSLFPTASGDTAKYYEEIYADAAKKQYCYTVPYTEKKYEYYYTASDDPGYDYVRLDSGYQSISDLKEKIEEVYSFDYTNSMYGTLFEGIVSGDVVMTPKYIETTASNGAMMLAQSNSHVPIKVEKRVYLFDTAKINALSSSKNLVRISIDSYLPSDPDKVTTREITLIYQRGNWFLNNPAF